MYLPLVPMPPVAEVLFTMWTILLILAGLTPIVLARQPYEWLDAAKQFSEDFLYPGNGIIAATGKYEVFAPNVKGRVDITTDFNGAELNVEYIFGLFALVDRETAHLEPTFLIPSAVSGNLQSLTIQDNIVSLSNILQFSYFKQNLTLPIQVDAWFAFDRDSGQMTQYDVTFRRWAWFWKETIPLLVPDIEIENNVPAGSMSQQKLLTLHAARRVCEQHSLHCANDPKLIQYDSFEHCLDFLINQRTFGEAWELGQDTTGCRYLHTAMLRYRPAEHCPHLGPAGGGMCIARNYTEVVEKPDYDYTWLAPTSNEPVSLEGISDDSKEALVKVMMMHVGPFTVGWFPIFAVVYFFILWLSAVATRAILMRTSKTFAGLTWAYQRTSVIYVLSIIYTTVALGLQFVALPTIWYTYAIDSVACIRLSGLVITGLYIFELIYRDFIRLPLLAHHLLTMIVTVFLIFCLDQVAHPSILTTAEVWLFQATLEQIVFLGLMSYRLQWSLKLTRFCLTQGAIASLILKVGAALWMLVIWGTKQRSYSEPIDKAFSAVLWITIPALLAAQGWGAWVCYRLALTVKERVIVLNTPIPNSAVPNSAITLWSPTDTLTPRKVAFWGKGDKSAGPVAGYPGRDIIMDDRVGESSNNNTRSTLTLRTHDLSK